jgi:hypothetical protein
MPSTKPRKPRIKHLDETEVSNPEMRRQRCQRCGRSNHTIESCYAKINIHGRSLLPSVSASIEVPKGESEVSNLEMCCQRCGRSSHTVENCYAKTDVHGRSLLPSMSTSTEASEGELESSRSDMARFIAPPIARIVTPATPRQSPSRDDQSHRVESSRRVSHEPVTIFASTTHPHTGLKDDSCVIS